LSKYDPPAITLVRKHYQEYVERMNAEVLEQQELVKKLKRNFASKFTKPKKNPEIVQ
jgi:hypothetical protein